MRILLPLQYEGADGRFSEIVIDDIDRELEDLSTVMGVRLRFIEEEPLGVNDPRSSRPFTTIIWVDMTPLNDDGAEPGADSVHNAFVHDGERDVDL